ncbi:MAG: hydroxyacylglutathione hydrolase [Oleiphilus sp.]|nr:MAG: hydroxyacylglutathione hydrolase [Oleiphilus sp.]
MLKISPIHAFHDNYIWCIFNAHSRKAVIVDPGDARPVLAHLEAEDLLLDALFITHHHPDHIGGLATLKETFDLPVYGYSNAAFKGVTHTLSDQEQFERLGCKWEVLTVPGHTLDHIAFFSPSQEAHQTPWLFCGDTLFSGGCGRLFEGTPAQMRSSLERIASLPDNTQIYPAHEYTLANLEFALQVEPDNEDTLFYQQQCKDKRAANLPTLPSDLRTESKINPFLRWEKPSVHDFARRSIDSTAPLSHDEVFASIRKAKDHF